MGDQSTDKPRGEPLTTMIWAGADRADLSPAVGMKPLARHRDQLPIAAQPKVIAELDRPRQKRTRLGPCNQLEHLGYIASAEQRCLRAVDPGDLLFNHLDQVKRL